MRIVIETIPHSEQRYATTGDWQMDREGENLLVRVSALGNWRMEALVGIHEAVEALLCHHMGVTQAQVDEFDKAFEAARCAKGSDSDAWVEMLVIQDKARYPDVNLREMMEQNGEPGDHPAAPYHLQHGFATAVERMLCAAMGLSWSKYEEKINELG